MADTLPNGRAYDYKKGTLVDSTIRLYNPGSVAGDRLSAQQWHLKRLGDMDKVWADFTGKGVHVGIYDDGVQKTHWDLDGKYDSSREVTINGTQVDGNAGSGGHGTSVAGIISAEKNGRGGVGIAYDSTITGVAILRPEGSPVDVNAQGENYLKALQQSASLFDVVNHSYGPAAQAVPITGGTSRGLAGSAVNAVAQVMEYTASFGRGGLGTNHVWAAGNSGWDGQSYGQATDRHAIAVGAYREIDGAASNYSNGGAHLLVSAPSSDFAILGGTGQWTTDLLGEGGYNLAIDPTVGFDYTDGFGGTSGAAPVVTGVVTLMLDANENLGWRDVRNILAASAKMPVAFDTGQVAINYQQNGEVLTTRLNEDVFHLNGQSANWNGGAMHYSNDYGYGAVDAYNAVRMAEVWGLFGEAKTSANEARITYQGIVDTRISGGDFPYPNAPTGFQVFGDFINEPVSVTFEMGANIDIEHIDLSLNFDAIVDSRPWGDTANEFQDLIRLGLMGAQFKLIAPDGTEGFVAARGGISQIITQNADNDEFTFGFSGFHGVESGGTWTLQMAAHSDLQFAFGAFPYEISSDVLVKGMKMDVYGSTPTNDDVHTYTNEFFTMAAIQGEDARKTLVDISGDNDWINAAAVSSDVKLSLVGGQATTFGGQQAFMMGRSTVIENAVTGDGNDTLMGNRYDNYLVGMRGNDVLNGGAGNDWLIGGTGNDRFQFDNRGTSGKDLVLDFAGGDMIGTQTALRGAGTDGKITVATNTLLLLDGTRTGDTAQLSQQGGAVIQSMGQKDGYYWYAFVSGTDIKSGDVIREESFQPTLTAAGSVDAIAVMSAAAHGSAVEMATGDAMFAGPVGEHGSFYLYDAMAGSMNGGVLLHA